MQRHVLWGLLALVLLVGACRPSGMGIEPGAASSQEAVLEFLNAARAEDLQAVSAVWGDEEGLARDRMERQELERRLILMACLLRHDESRIGEAQRGEGGRLVHTVVLRQGTKEATVPFTTARNRRSGRWFVQEFDTRPVRDFCTRSPATPPAR